MSKVNEFKEPEKFKIGDKVMGIVENRIMSGTVNKIDYVGFNSQWPIYTLVDSKQELAGVLSESQVARFDAFKWMQAEIFHREYKEHIEKSNKFLSMTKTTLFSRGTR